MQGLTDTFAEHERQGFTIYNVVVDDYDSEPPTAADAAEWQDVFGLPWTVVYDAHSETADYEPEVGLPASWLLDEEGRVVWIHRGKGALVELEDELDDLL